MRRQHRETIVLRAKGGSPRSKVWGAEKVVYGTVVDTRGEVSGPLFGEIGFKLTEGIYMRKNRNVECGSES